MSLQKHKYIFLVLASSDIFSLVIATMCYVMVITTLLVIFFVWSGFTKNPNVEIINYSLNEDGSQLSFTIGIPNSIGYTRGYKNKGGGVKSHYLNFYNTFGTIFVNRTDGGYEWVLQKNEETGEWERPSKSNN